MIGCGKERTMEHLNARHLNHAELQKLLRHRPPMLLIDRVDDYEPGKSMTALVAASGASDWAQGHFPGRAIYPGTHLLQAFSQTAIMLLQLSTTLLGDDEVTVVSSLEARFNRVVVPGDLIVFKTILDRTVQDLFFFSGSASVGEQRVASFKVNVARRPVTALGERL
jgi:3-hydroxyacyl-[acyl-carrier-protein] dehydratase